MVLDDITSQFRENGHLGIVEEAGNVRALIGE